MRDSNPVGWGRNTFGRRGSGHQRGHVPRLTKLPWIPTEQQWADILFEVRAKESRAIGKRGIRNLRRLQYHDPTAPGWRVTARGGQCRVVSPPTAHRRRAVDDAIAVLLTRYAELGQTFWGWSTEEWIHLLGRDQTEFRQNAPDWAGDEIRPYLACGRISARLLHRVPPARQLPKIHPVVANLWSRPRQRRDRQGS